MSRLLPKVTPLPVRAALGVAGLLATTDPFFFFWLFCLCSFSHLVSNFFDFCGYVGHLLPAVIRAGLDLCVLRSIVFDVCCFFTITHVYVKCRNCVCSFVRLHEFLSIRERSLGIFVCAVLYWWTILLNTLLRHPCSPAPDSYTSHQDACYHRHRQDAVDGIEQYKHVR